MTDRAPLAACYYNKKCWTAVVLRTEKCSRAGPAQYRLLGGGWILAYHSVPLSGEIGKYPESWAITMHNDMSLNENWNTSSLTHSPELFVTPTSWRSIALSFTHTLFQLTLTVPLLDNHQCSDNAVSINSSMFCLLNIPTCYYPRDFPIFQIWWPGQCLVIVQDSWSPVSSFALYLGPEWRVERREWEGGRGVERAEAFRQ